MPRNGTGTYSLAQPPFTPGTTISSAAVNSDFSDIATALTQSVASNGETTITGQLKFPVGSAAAPSHSFAADLTTGMFYPGSKQLGFSAGGIDALLIDTNLVGTGQDGSILKYANGAILVPVGIQANFGGATAPVGWLFPYGQNVSRTGYPELFQVYGTAYGSGDGSTTFGMPDLRGRVVAGMGDMGGVDAGRLTATTMTPNGITLGAIGGAQTLAINQVNLPNVAFPNSLSIVDPGHVHALQPNTLFLGGPTAVRGDLASTTVNGQSATQSATTGITLSGSVTSGGSGTPVSVVQPTFVMNKIVFAGRP